MIAIFLLVLPSLVWTARNFEKTEMVIFSSLSGMNLLEETASGVMAINEDIEEEESFLKLSMLNMKSVGIGLKFLEMK